MRLSAGGGHETTAKKTRRPLCHRLGRLLANDSLVDAQLVLVDNTNTPSRERGKKMVIVDVEWRVFFPLLSHLFAGSFFLDVIGFLSCWGGR